MDRRSGPLLALPALRLLKFRHCLAECIHLPLAFAAGDDPHHISTRSEVQLADHPGLIAHDFFSTAFQSQSPRLVVGLIETFEFSLVAGHRPHIGFGEFPVRCQRVAAHSGFGVDQQRQQPVRGRHDLAGRDFTFAFANRHPHERADRDENHDVEDRRNDREEQTFTGEGPHVFMTADVTLNALPYSY